MHYTQMLSDFSEEEIAEIEAERDRDKALHPQKISAAAGKAGFPRTPFRDGKGRLKGFSKFFAPHRFKSDEIRSHMDKGPGPAARNAHVLSGYVERVTRRQLWIGKNRRGLLGEDSLSEKQED